MISLVIKLAISIYTI